MLNVEKSIQLKNELETLRPLKKEDELRIMQKFRLDWNYHSNHLEGNSLTYGETKALILFNITAQGKPLKDHIEVTGHDEAIKWIMDIVKKERPLTENFIRELHKLILKEPYEVDAITPDGNPTKKTVNVGVYKTIPNHVRTKTGEIFRFATPEETPSKMSDLIDWYRKKIEADKPNPILIASEFHYRFIRIHPFDDGNGRTARILMNFILMQFGYPPVIIKTEDKQNYFSVLQQADAGLLEPFIEYIAKNLNHSLEIMIKGAKGENIEDPDDLDKEIALLEKKLDEIDPPIIVVKNMDIIRNLYEHSISLIVKKFVDKCRLFDNFYSELSFSIKFNDKVVYKTFKNAIEGNVHYTHGKIDKIDIEYLYNAFNRSKFTEFNYESRLRFIFHKTKYLIKGSDEYVLLVKLYSEQLSEEEMDQLINSEIRKHKEFIEQKIKEQTKQ